MCVKDSVFTLLNDGGSGSKGVVVVVVVVGNGDDLLRLTNGYQHFIQRTSVKHNCILKWQ